MNAVLLGARLAWSRLTSWRGRALALAAWLVVVGGAWLERSAGSKNALDDALRVTSFGLVLPVCACWALELTCAGERLDAAVEPLARAGANRKLAALGLAAVAAASFAAFGALLATSTVAIVRPLADTNLLADLWATTWMGALCGAAYASWFTLGSAFGRAGRGRLWALLVDFALGSAAGSALASPFPRGHVRDLLAIAPDAPVLATATILVAFSVLYGALASARSPA